MRGVEVKVSCSDMYLQLGGVAVRGVAVRGVEVKVSCSDMYLQ